MISKSYFLLSLIIGTHICDAQKTSGDVLDPLVHSALQQWADNLKQTIGALQSDKIEEAVTLACQAQEKEWGWESRFLQEVTVYTSAMIDYHLKVAMFDYYLRAGGCLSMSPTDSYSIMFSDVLCRTAWCNLYKQAISNYDEWYGIPNAPVSPSKGT